MFDIGAYPATTCSNVGRRSFLRVASSAALGLGLPGVLAAERKPRARSVLFVFLWGGPSHLDTCDPKPDAPVEYRGPFGIVPTRTPGVHFTELVPRLAQRSHRFTLIRSHATTNSGHPQAGTLALTGFDEVPAPPQPNFGAVLARGRPYAGKLPPFVSLANGVLMDSTTPIRGYGGGRWGARYDPSWSAAPPRGTCASPRCRFSTTSTPPASRTVSTFSPRSTARPAWWTAPAFSPGTGSFNRRTTCCSNRPRARRST